MKVAIFFSDNSVGDQLEPPGRHTRYTGRSLKVNRYGRREASSPLKTPSTARSFPNHIGNTHGIDLPPPATTTVPVGTTVTWTNYDDIPHNVVSPEQKFKSRALDSDDTFAHTFDVAGTYKYYCSIHPRMTGQIVVR